MGKIGVFIAVPSKDFIELFCEKLDKADDIEIIGTATSGTMAEKGINEGKPDVLLMDLVLPGLDGINLLRHLREKGEPPRTVVLSGFVNDRIAATLSELDVDFFFAKPCRADDIIDSIRECALPKSKSGETVDEGSISRALIAFGILPHLQGYRFLWEAISMALGDSGMLRGVTKILYPDIAKRFGTNADCVERSMRTAIQKAWENGSPELRRRCFGEFFEGCAKAPTNSRFIAAIVEFIELSNEKRMMRL